MTLSAWWTPLAIATAVLLGCHSYPVASGDSEEPTALAGTVRTPAELAVLQPRAEAGDIGAMHTLATHYFGTEEPERAQHWLRQAARLGDCLAILLILERAHRSDMAESEVAHWNAESQRLACEEQEARREAERRRP